MAQLAATQALLSTIGPAPTLAPLAERAVTDPAVAIQLAAAQHDAYSVDVRA